MGSRSRTQQQSSQEQTNLNLSDFEGVGIAGSEDVEITTRIEQFDPGLADIAESAFDTSRSIADDANNLAGQAIRANQDVTVAGLDYGEDVLEDALLFGGDAVGSVEAIASESVRRSAEGSENVIDAVGQFLRESFGFGENAIDVVSEQAAINRGVFSEALDAVTRTTDKATATLSSAIGQAADATRTDSANVLNNLIKYGAIAVGIVAVGFVISRAK